MTKEQILKCREIHKENFLVYCGDGNFYDESLEGIYLIWDDDNGLLHVVCPNVHYRKFIDKPVSIISINYDSIDSISRVYNLGDAEKMINEIKGVKKYQTTNIMVELKKIAPYSK